MTANSTDRTADAGESVSRLGTGRPRLSGLTEFLRLVRNAARDLLPIVVVVAFFHVTLADDERYRPFLADVDGMSVTAR